METNQVVGELLSEVMSGQAISGETLMRAAEASPYPSFAQAVTIRRELAAARPAAFLPGLAGSLLNHSNCLAELGRREEALATIEQAAGIYRQLAAARPAAFLPGLAASLNNQSLRLADLERRRPARTAGTTRPP